MDETQPEQKKKQTVLIVEDEPMVLDMYAQKLTAEGFTVLKADDGPPVFCRRRNSGPI